MKHDLVIKLYGILLFSTCGIWFYNKLLISF